MDFIGRKNSRWPEFLDKVSEIQEKKAAEAQIKLEAEMAKQRKVKDTNATAELKAADKKWLKSRKDVILLKPWQKC